MAGSIRALLALLLVAGCSPKDSGPGAAKPALVRPQTAAEIIAEQAPYYAIPTCLACGGTMGSAALEVVTDGKLMRVCSPSCSTAVLENAAYFVATRDSALITAQLASYPTDSCIVMVDTLDLFHTPRNLIYGARLVRLCCETCEEQFLAEPATFLAVLDEMEKSRPLLRAAPTN